MTMTKHANLLLLLFILIVSVGYYCVVGNQDHHDVPKMKMRRELMMGINKHLFQSTPGVDCDTEPCDPTLDHCEDITCGECTHNEDGTTTCTVLPIPYVSENCLEEECINETDKECFVVGCPGGCDTDSLSCKLPSPPPEQPDAEQTTAGQVDQKGEISSLDDK